MSSTSKNYKSLYVDLLRSNRSKEFALLEAVGKAITRCLQSKKDHEDWWIQLDVLATEYGRQFKRVEDIDDAIEREQHQADNGEAQTAFLKP